MVPGANTTVSIYRMIYGASTNTYPASPDLTDVEAYIESQKAEVQAALDQGFNVDVFYMHIDPVDIDVNDKVVDSYSKEYRVAGIERHENNPDTDDLLTITLHKERHTTH
jgi:hypothetical protein